MSYVYLLVSFGQRQREGMLREPDRLAVTAHVRVSADGIRHLRECEVTHGDGAAALNPEAGLAVEWNEGVFAHENSTAHVGQTAQILEVAPHQDGAFTLPPECAVHGEHVDVHGGAAGLVEGQCVLEQSGYRAQLLIVFRVQH